MNILIRKYENQDFDAVVELMNEFGDYLVNVDVMGRSRREADFGSFFTEKMISEAEGKGLVLVAEADGQLVALAAGVVQDPTSFDHLQAVPARSGRITELYRAQGLRAADGAGTAIPARCPTATSPGSRSWLLSFGSRQWFCSSAGGDGEGKRSKEPPALSPEG